MYFIINLIIWVIVLGILFKVLELALSIFKIPVSAQVWQLVGLLFLLVLLVQVFGMAGMPVPHYIWYH